jgi:hypothetical protein
MGKHRDTLRRNATDADRALSAVAEAVRAQAKLLPEEVATDIVKRARAKGVLGGRPEVQNVVAALLGYATHGLDTLRSARSRVRKIIEFAIASDVTVPELAKSHGGFWKVYEAARGARDDGRSAGRRVTIFLPQALEERVLASRSVIQLVPSDGRLELREVLLIAGLSDSSCSEDDGGKLLIPASEPGGEPGVANDGTGTARDLAVGAGAAAPDAVEGGAGPEMCADTTLPTSSGGESVDLFWAATDIPVGPSFGASQAEPLAPQGEGVTVGGAEDGDPVAAMSTRFLGRKFIIGPLTDDPAKFAELKRCATSERRRLKGSGRDRNVWTAHTMTPLLALTLQQHDARTVADDELDGRPR